MYMARMYRETVTNFNKSITLPAQLVYTVSPIDADQIPNGYLKTLKISVIPNNKADLDLSYMIVASTNDLGAETSDWITAGAVPQGGGTVWLNLKRPVKSSAEEPNRPDGEVYVHVIVPGASGANPTELNLVGEVWGRFLNMAAN